MNIEQVGISSSITIFKIKKMREILVFWNLKAVISPNKAFPKANPNCHNNISRGKSMKCFEWSNNLQSEITVNLPTRA